MPTPSWPGTNGGDGLTGQSPWAAWMSVWQRPDASTLHPDLPGSSASCGDLLDDERRAEVVHDGGAIRRE